MDHFFAHLHHRLLSFKKQLAFAISKKVAIIHASFAKKVLYYLLNTFVLWASLRSISYKNLQIIGQKRAH